MRNSCSAGRLDGNENWNEKDDGPAFPVFFILKRKGLLIKAAIIDCTTRTTFVKELQASSYRVEGTNYQVGPYYHSGGYLSGRLYAIEVEG
jgi:hypothetical protein